MKSIKPLPESVYSRLGIAIKEVTNVDGSVEFTPIDLGQYRRNKRRKVKDNGYLYYYVDGENYLYLPNSDVEVVNLKILTVKPEDIEGVEGCDVKRSCISIWDREFVIADKLEQATYKDALITELAGIQRRIVPDENPDMNEHSKV